MNRLREYCRRLLRQGREHSSSSLAYSYRVYWTKTARMWGEDRRRQVRAAVQSVTRLPGFTPNERLRRYPVPQIDDLPHAGASLVALLEVLDALESDTGDAQDG